MSRISRRTFLGATVTANALAASNAGVAASPNVLLLFSDQHNARVLGCAGNHDVKTPNLDRLAHEGVLFERAYCQDAVCAPSRTSMLTGQYPRTLGVLHNPDPALDAKRFVPMQRRFQQAGYLTGAFGKRHIAHGSGHNSSSGYDYGFDVTCTTLKEVFDPSDECYWDWIEKRGLLSNFERDWDAEFGNEHEPPRSAPMACRVSELPEDATMEAYAAEKSIDFIYEAKRQNRPFFCWTSFYRPHQPYTPQPSYVAMYNPDKLTMPGSMDEPADHLPPLLAHYRKSTTNPWCFGSAAEDESLYRRFLAYYYALVTEIDAHVGRILDVLDHMGELDNTIIIYTSDHGDFACYHGMIEKICLGHNVYEETLRVPLIMRVPGNKKNQTRDDLVELVDLYPTLLDVCGLTSDERLPGKSLKEVLRGTGAVERRVAFSENWGMLTAIGPRYKLGAWINRPEGEFPDMMFDRASDPLEMVNCVDDHRVAPEKQTLIDAMKAWIDRTPNVTDKPLKPEIML